MVGTRGKSWVEEREANVGERREANVGERSGAGRGLRERGRERRPRLSTEGCRGEERPQLWTDRGRGRCRDT